MRNFSYFFYLLLVILYIKFYKNQNFFISILINSWPFNDTYILILFLKYLNIFIMRVTLLLLQYLDEYTITIINISIYKILLDCPYWLFRCN